MPSFAACLKEPFDKETPEATRILYGGSVKPDNVDGLMAQDDIDGSPCRRGQPQGRRLRPHRPVPIISNMTYFLLFATLRCCDRFAELLK